MGELERIKDRRAPRIRAHARIAGLWWHIGENQRGVKQTVRSGFDIGHRGGARAVLRGAHIPRGGGAPRTGFGGAKIAKARTRAITGRGCAKSQSQRAIKTVMRQIWYTGC